MGVLSIVHLERLNDQMDLVCLCWTTDLPAAALDFSTVVHCPTAVPQFMLCAADATHQALLQVQAEAERAPARADPGQHKWLAIQAQKGCSEAAPEGVRSHFSSPTPLNPQKITGFTIQA